MIITKFIKTLNKTEIGARGMKDKSVAIPSSSKLPIFPNNEFEVITLESGKVDDRYKIRVDLHGAGANNQLRIYQLREFFEKNDAAAGDRFIFQIHKNGENTQCFIGLQKRPYVILFLYNKNKGFDVLNPELFDDNCENGVLSMRLMYEGEEKNVVVKYSLSDSKRSDSKGKTTFYELKVDDDGEFFTKEPKDKNSLNDKYYVEIDLGGKILRKVITAETHVYNLGV